MSECVTYDLALSNTAVVSCQNQSFFIEKQVESKVDGMFGIAYGSEILPATKSICNRQL